MRVLVAEDTRSLAEAIAKALGGSGYTVDIVENGEDAEAAARAFPYDAVILDLSLPGMDDLDVLSCICERGDEMPVLILTARSTLNDRVKGLNLGADDYLTKPFEISELETRLRAIIRRSHGRKNAVLSAGRITFDTVHRAVEIDDHATTMVFGHRALISEALGNLIQNAMAYCPEGSAITVRCCAGASAPVLEVEDNGPGIPADRRGEVRERFVRLNSNGAEGSGLSLAIVQKIAALHGGSLEIGDGSGRKGLRARIVFSALV